MNHPLIATHTRVPALGRTARMASTSRLRNVFREGFEYRITPEGAARLAAGSGASPAFLAVLAIAAAGPVSFSVIAEGMSHIGPDDLELWLSAMCDMGLLENALAPALVPEQAGADVAAPDGGAAGHEAVAGPDADLPVVLLVHKDARARANWRRALGGHGYALLECARLEAVEDALRERKPEWVVLGLEGEDFEGLHLLRAMKRPRTRQVARVCLVVPRGHALESADAATAERADARAASVTDIVRAVCGEAALGEAAGPQDSEAVVDTCAPAMTAESAAASADVAGHAHPAGEPVWMNLLYGASAPYGGPHAAEASPLEAHYPRLVLRMIEGWRKPGFERELNDLILDDRGDRHGFPPEVMEELWFLQRVHQESPDPRADPAHL